MNFFNKIFKSNRTSYQNLIEPEPVFYENPLHQVEKPSTDINKIVDVPRNRRTRLVKIRKKERKHVAATPSALKCYEEPNGIDCLRCEDHLVSVRIESNDGYQESMCINCKNSDESLAKLHIIPLSDNVNITVCEAIPKPRFCERCHQRPPDIKLILPDVGALEFICQVCVKKDRRIRIIS